ncbi:MAG: hypothetical protein KDK41_00950 [Leptospiraceae bacterium]|nr:hypothetical protein [Leptospiraceae bacterium]
MTYHWKYIKAENLELPEIYFLKNQTGDRIRVETNRLSGMVKIRVEKNDSSLIEATIRNGVLLRELDLSAKAPKDLSDDFQRYRLDLSSLPDTGILRLIGGNYGIMTEFLGSAEKKAFGPESEVVVKKIRDLVRKIIGLPFRFLRFLRDGVLQKPRFSDLLDISFVMGLAAGVYSINFNAVQSGFLIAVGAFAGVMLDILVRRNDVLLSKFLILGITGVYGLHYGFIYQ